MRPSVHPPSALTVSAQRRPLRVLIAASLSLVLALVLALALAACGSDPADPTDGPPSVDTPNFVRSLDPPWLAYASSAHEFGVDLGVRRTGRSGYVRSIAPVPSTENAFGALIQSISALEYRGKRLRLSGFVRTDQVTGKGAGLWMRIDSPTRTTAFDNMIEFQRPLLGDVDWTKESVVLDVAPDAIGVTFGLLLSGGGVARVDDITLEVVDTSVPTTGTTSGVPDGRDSVSLVAQYTRLAHAPENLDFEGSTNVFELTSQWIKSATRPFDTAEPGSGTADLAELGRIIGNARVAAFGEATHGSREFFKMKHRAFEYLVETLGYTHFLIEATMPEARALDRYVATGEGDPAKLLANLYFWTWNTQEVLDLIQWMRTYNLRAGTPRLRFFGIDMQYPHQAMDSITTMLARADAQVAAQATQAVACFDPVRDSNRQLNLTLYEAKPEQFRNQCALLLRQLDDTVAAHVDEWGSSLASDETAWLQQYITLARQWERMARVNYNAGGSRERDRAMADNVLWIAAREPQAKLFVWAHNAHVSRRATAMGQHLGDALGDAYRNVAFTFGSGRFNAVTVLPSGAYGALQAHQVSGPRSGSPLESYLLSTLAPRLILDTHKVTSGESGTFVLDRRPLYMRSIGAVFSPENPNAYYENVLLPLDYDGIIWFVFVVESQLLLGR